MKKKVKFDNINGFPGFYISPQGAIYSRYDNCGRLTQEWYRRKTYIKKNGYEHIVLKIRKLNRIQAFYIHRLVAEAWIPNPLRKPCVCHIDNNRLNNHYKNLYWGTHKENMEQAFREDRVVLRKLKAIVFSDLHLNDWNKHPKRLDTAFKVLQHISSRCEEEQVPAIHCGDLFHKPENLSNYLFNRVVEEFNKLSNRSWVMYYISGNHSCYHKNTIERGMPNSWENTLSKVYPWLISLDFRGIKLNPRIKLHGVPYIDNNIGLSEYLSRIPIRNKKQKQVLVLHTSYPGAKDTDGIEVNSDNISINTLDKFDLTLMGHVHKPQRLGKKVYMIGCPYQQRRTDRSCELGYWELYSDLSMKFIPLNNLPKFIDVEDESQIKDDGNYYTVLSKTEQNTSIITNPIRKGVSRKGLVRRYLRTIGEDDRYKKQVLTQILESV